MSKLKKLNVSEVDGNSNSVFPAGTVWIDQENRLRVSDGVTEGGQPLVSGAFGDPAVVYPTAGSSTAGIIFPSDPGGGSGDIASIKYYATSGEQMRLHIDIQNDLEDHILMTASGPITIQPNEQAFVFGTDGAILPPTLSTARGDNPSGTISGYTIKIGDGANEAVITTPDGVNADSQRLVINPGKGKDGTSGEGGDIYLWAGRGGTGDGTTGGGSGGDIKIRGGQGMLDADGGYIRMEGGDSSGAGQGGYIEIRAGYTYGGTAGHVNIQGGYNSSGTGGDVTLISGYGNPDYGNVVINTTGGINLWKFDNAGTLTLPYNATIKTTSDYAIAIGVSAGTGGSSAVSLGSSAGSLAQSFDAIAIGAQAGANTQGSAGIAIGSSAGYEVQGSSAIAIGPNAGQFSQGQSAIAIGGSAGYNMQAENSIVINASGTELNNTTANSLVIDPIRNDNGNTSNALYYNTSTKEIGRAHV